MIAALQELQGRSASCFEVNVIDIDQYPALETKWGDKVPVLLDDDVEICHYFLDPDRLTMHLSHLPIRPTVNWFSSPNLGDWHRIVCHA